MNKRGTLDLSLETIIRIVVVVLALILVWGISYNVINLFISQENKATERNFESLHDYIITLPEYAKTPYPIYLGEDYIVFGFSQGQSSITGTCEQLGIEDLEKVIKPLQCGNDACLCLCEKDGFGCEDNTEECYTDFGEIFYFEGLQTENSTGCDFPVIVGSEASQVVVVYKPSFDKVRIGYE